NRVDGVRGQKFVTQAGDVESDKKTGDRKSTRLNSSHTSISYAVFCLKKKQSRKQRQKTFKAMSRQVLRGGDRRCAPTRVSVYCCRTCSLRQGRPRLHCSLFCLVRRRRPGPTLFPQPPPFA